MTLHTYNPQTMSKLPHVADLKVPPAPLLLVLEVWHVKPTHMKQDALRQSKTLDSM